MPRCISWSRSRACLGALNMFRTTGLTMSDWTRARIDCGVGKVACVEIDVEELTFRGIEAVNVFLETGKAISSGLFNCSTKRSLRVERLASGIWSMRAETARRCLLPAGELLIQGAEDEEEVEDGGALAVLFAGRGRRVRYRVGRRR